ncbi:hypothetical protein WS71_06475 [Burkholderia mayonis]|uniref:Uncharacterized protein n=1 Tax=Burkholderia mayonis TaxID=1385591 RepID=A0A1B4FTJ7_9BURK|nr:hypothetical protein WS71_06475 [Burkholderia mayonis]
MYRIAWLERSLTFGASRFPDLTFRGKDEDKDAVRTVAGAPAGVRNKSVGDFRLTIPTINLCGSLTKPSIRHSIFKAGVLCDESLLLACVRAVHFEYLGPGRNSVENTSSLRRL